MVNSLHGTAPANNNQELFLIFQPSQHKTLIIEEFEPDVFRQLIEYIHTGAVTLQPRTLLGNILKITYYLLEILFDLRLFI